MPSLGRVFQHLADFCYPSACACCDVATPSGSGARLCEPCRHKLMLLSNAGACGRCAKPLSAGAVCPWCHGRGVAPYQAIIRLGSFDEPLKDLIHQMKYQKRWPLGEMLADMVCATDRAKDLLAGTEVLVPVPLHFRRQFQRGYNQAEVIARRIGSRRNSRGISVVQAIKRKRNTETQTHLHSIQARQSNVRGAFALKRCAQKLKGKHVVVIDDVSTTGATLKAVGNLLKQVEPASLSAVVIAIADPRGRGFEAI